MRNKDLDWIVDECAGAISKRFCANGLCTFRSVLEWVHRLPYGRNSDRANYTLIFSENCGTCSTKHAALAALCSENRVEAELQLAICQLDRSMASFLNILGVHDFPEAHCYLRYKGRDIDVTYPEQEPILKAKILKSYSLHPNEIGERKVALHHQYICRWMRENKLDKVYSFDRVWQLREDWIKT